MVPAPRGMRAVGDGLVLDFSELERLASMLGVAGDVGKSVADGEMGFILRPLGPGPVRRGAGGCSEDGGAGMMALGVRGRTLLR